MSNGVILWEGPSVLDGAPVVCIATGIKKPSSNRKTGDMIQTWILRADVAPVAALASGQDASVCGLCPHRPAVRRAAAPDDRQAPCYVEVGRAPQQVYAAYKRGRYPHATGGEFSGRRLRVGSYGDPAAVPVEVWQRALQGTTGHTGYTHQWHTADKRLARICMASADSLADMREAHRKQWRTFRVRTASDTPQRGEVVCPASDEGGKKLTCAMCGACNGTATGRKGSVVIIAH